jgi:hypothetical protein
MGVAMPRVESSAEGGLRIREAYAALLALESDRFERSERTAARMKAEGDGTFYRRNSGWLVERLEASETVTVDRATVELALWERDRSPRPVRLPFDREVRSVRVSSDDQVAPAADLKRDGAAAMTHDGSSR